MNKVKRQYDSSHRKVQAEETRRQILAAARRLFVERGYNQTTIEEIAQWAEVAAPTVYANYGGKRALLLKLLDEIEGIADTSSLMRALSDHTLTESERLRAFIDFSVRLFTDGADLIRIAELAGVSDPDVAALWNLGEARRMETCRKVLAGWDRRGLFRKDLPPTRALEFLWAISGPEFHALFVRKRGWPPHEFAEWLYRLAAEQLLGPANPPTPKSLPAVRKRQTRP